MLNNNVFYHGIIRKTIVSFGSLFSGIFVDRKVGEDGPDSINGNTIQRLQVPIAYAPKEKWLVRIEQDPTLETHTLVTLPRLSFEVTGYSYDTSRKLNKMNQITYRKVDGGGNTLASRNMFTPVPYIISIRLYVITKTQEDAMQIIEQILPTFGPEYTMSINAIPEMCITQDIPVTLNNITVEDNYDGAFQQRRFVIHTLSFELRVNLFGNINDSKLIYTSMANISANPDMSNPTNKYTVKGDPETQLVIPNSEDPESDIWIEGL